MASKVAAMLVLCCTFVLTIRTIEAELLLVEYGKCFKGCHDSCQSSGNNDVFCKLKCDNECMAKKTADKLYKVEEDIATARQNAQNTVPIGADGLPAQNSEPSNGQAATDTDSQMTTDEQSTEDTMPQVNN